VAETRENRECGHAEIQPGGECELCDVDWLIQSGEGDQRENRRNRRAILREQVVAAQREARP
jgi:hypothetical protein